MAGTTNRLYHWLRILRPLFLWLVLFLVLYGIRTNERLLEQTRLYFSTSLNGQPLPYLATSRLDGKPFDSGQKISLGNHRFEIVCAKTEPFATNLSIWYGKHDLGDISLKRTTGTLSVKADPPAPTITITGPEFSTNLQNSSGILLTVPTDAYSVNVQYQHWADSQTIPVTENAVAPATFSPKFGVLHLSCNRDGATFQLQNSDGQTFENGNFPETLDGIPAGVYHLVITHHNHQIQRTVRVEASVTNDVPVDFQYGSAIIESVPPGAAVYDRNNIYRGATPLQFSELVPPTFNCHLEMNGYQSVPVSLEIIADQTNFFQTNLVSFRYAELMQEAQTYLAASNYVGAAQAATEVLNAMPHNADAQALLDAANQTLEAERKRQKQLKLPQMEFDKLCNDNPDANLFAGHELITGKPAKAVADAIAQALQQEPHPLKVLSSVMLKPGIYQVIANQTFSLGILGGTERYCFIIVGQAKEDETQVFYKVLEYQISHTIGGNSIFSIKDNKQMIPVSPSKMQMTDVELHQVKDGLQIVTERIQQAIGQ